MTIKDLAEMTVNFGLVCQNVSAASQAITTYIRTHTSRCEAQQDHPLLLRHILSGTPADDDLLPALYSRSGGAQCAAHPDHRATNFRRGTVVWYLSRATGAPCPFSRAGIRLCDYGEEGIFNSSKEKKREREREKERRVEQCGQKRKRPLRGCVAKGSESDSQNEETPPPKVKLTLRLKPLCRKSPSSDQSSTSNSLQSRIIDLSKDTESDSDDSRDGSMSIDSSDEADDETRPGDTTVEEDSWSLPPYPRRSISIPCYTPSLDGPYPYFLPSVPTLSEESPYRRSPSVPYSVGSPPPDSEDEDDDFHISMTGARRHYTAPSRRDDLDWDADLDSEGDDTVWESPGPRSPSAPILHTFAEVAVKEEISDVQGMLEAWEDFDSNVAGAKVVEVIAQATAHALENESTSKVKTESLDSWNWESPQTTLNDDWYATSDGELSTRIKQEDFDIDTLLYPEKLTSDLHSPQSLGAPSPPSLSMSPFADSPSPPVGYGDQWRDGNKQYATMRPRAKTVPTPFSFFAEATQSSSTSFTLPLTPPPELPGVFNPPADLISPSSPVSQSIAFPIQSMSMNSPTSVAASSLRLPPPCISPLDTRCKGNAPSESVVVVHTCQPCTPAISATQIEGISVYQMMLSSFSLLRRIDTDFVNLSPIVAYLGATYPVLSMIPNAAVVTKGSPTVSGTWVPLSAAQAYVRDHPLEGGPLDIFLSDVLFERFPTALQDFHRSSTPGRLLNHFGPPFESTLQATRLFVHADAPAWNGWMQEELQSVPARPVSASEKRCDEADMPLSVTEQEIFHALCDSPDWDKENTPSSPRVMLMDEKVTSMELEADAAVDRSTPNVDIRSDRRERPLRRSKRVADALAAQSRAPTTRWGGPRNNSIS